MTYMFKSTWDFSSPLHKNFWHSCKPPSCLHPHADYIHKFTERENNHSFMGPLKETIQVQIIAQCCLCWFSQFRAETEVADLNEMSAAKLGFFFWGFLDVYVTRMMFFTIWELIRANGEWIGFSELIWLCGRELSCTFWMYIYRLYDDKNSNSQAASDRETEAGGNEADSSEEIRADGRADTAPCSELGWAANVWQLSESPR